MTGKIRRILVAIRELDRAPGALLQKVSAIARSSGASVELFHAIDEPVPVSNVQRALAGNIVQRLLQEATNRAMARLRACSKVPALRGLRVSCHATWDFPAHEAIVRRALQTRSDLLIATSHTRGLGGRWLLHNTDWELIRQCPCPLLLVKSRKAYRKPAIIVAVDPFHTHAKPANLDRRLLQYGSAIARLLKGSVHAVHCYTPLMNVMPMPAGAGMPVILPPEVEASHRELVTQTFDRLTKAAGVAPGARHLRVGSVRGELTSLVTELNAGLVVMGAVSRSALRRAFIGSSAERVLDHLLCDVLVVKPRGFKSSVLRRPGIRTRRS